MARPSEAPTIETLRGPGFELLDQLRHDDLLVFAARYFFERTSWITRLHHALSIVCVVTVVAAGVVHHIPITHAIGQFFFGFLVMFVAVLPVHEALHALGYWAAGAREISWKMMWRYLAAYVVADRFVAGRRVFFFVALLPFVVITPIALALAFVFPQWSVLWLTVLLWHTAGVSGDWALMNYYWIHRDREIYTWDEDGNSYFYARRSMM